MALGRSCRHFASWRSKLGPWWIERWYNYTMKMVERKNSGKWMKKKKMEDMDWSIKDQVSIQQREKTFPVATARRCHGHPREDYSVFFVGKSESLDHWCLLYCLDFKLRLSTQSPKTTITPSALPSLRRNYQACSRSENASEICNQNYGLSLVERMSPFPIQGASRNAR